MSEKLTRIHLPGLPMGEGFMDWGERTADEMVAIMRRRANHMREVVAAIDAASDADFAIDIIRGPHVQHFVRNVQPGRTEDSAREARATTPSDPVQEKSE